VSYLCVSYLCVVICVCVLFVLSVNDIGAFYFDHVSFVFLSCVCSIFESLLSDSFMEMEACRFEMSLHMINVIPFTFAHDVHVEC